MNDTAVLAPAPRGRRPDQRKREAIVAAAGRLFLEQGYGVSVEAIAQAANVSKQTVYKAFATKEGLFAAVAGRLADEIAAPLTQARPDSATPSEVLTEFARHLFTVVQTENAIALHRMLLAGQAQFPDLARTFYRVGPGHTLEQVAQYLGREAARGRLAAPDPRQAAEHFLGMLNGHGYMRRLFGVEAHLPPETLESRIRAAIGAFLRAYGMPAGQANIAEDPGA